MEGMKQEEPRVVTADVQRVLRRVVVPGSDETGDSVVALAERANTSARTVYRVLSKTSETLSLDLADRLCLAADAHLSECRLSWANGRITSYHA